MSLAQLRILIAIDQQLFLNGFHDLFRKNGLPVCNIIDCSRHLAKEFNTEGLDIALIDLNSPKINGKDATSTIVKSFPQAQLIMLSLYVDTALIKQVKEAGKKGYLEAGSKIFDLIQTVTTLTTGTEDTEKPSEYLIDDTKINLSARELQVLRLIAEGCTGPEIADILKIKPETARGYRKSLIEKLKVRNTAELVAKGIRNGLIYI